MPTTVALDENVAVAGLNYQMFAIPGGAGMPPFYLNCHVYSCTLVLNSIPHRWRGRYNEDADLCRRLARRGFELAWHPRARILHHWSRSAGAETRNWRPSTRL